MTIEHRTIIQTNRPALFVEDLTAEVKAARRREQLRMEHALLRALKAAGYRTAHHGGRLTVLVDECLCREPLPIDPDYPSLTRPRIRRFSLYCPLHDVELTPLQVTDRWRKTPQKEQRYLEKVFPHEPQGTDHFVVEAGPEYERHGLSTDLQTALAEADAKPDEPLRACIVRCRDRTRAAEVVEEKRDSLPWAEGLQLRDDGALPVGWHGLPLTVLEKRELEQQQRQDKAVKRQRLEKLARQMLREGA